MSSAKRKLSSNDESIEKKVIKNVDEPSSSSSPVKQGVVIKLAKTSKNDVEKQQKQTKLIATDKKLKQIFNDDDDDLDEETMPESARMKMRNVGRDTPTSSGPNSFSKGKRGFVDIRKIAERKLDELTKKLGDDEVA